MGDSDEDTPVLSPQAVSALQQFYSEGRRTHAERNFTVGEMEEDWRLSQFWYDNETATRLAEELVHEAGDGGRIACVCAPSVYQKLKQFVVSGSVRVSAVVFEFDRRFSAYGDDFVFYDFNEPLRLPAAVAAETFDVVMADPPYLSEECLGKVAQTAKFLSKGKILLCTGSIMEEVAGGLLGVSVCRFLPRHNRNLSNEFRCFVNYPSALLSSESD